MRRPRRSIWRQWWKARPTRDDGQTPVPERWLFPGRKAGRPMTTRQLNRLFHEAADAAGITKAVTLHSLRHSFATHLLDRGVDIRIIQALLGHEKLDTTARYTRVATGTIAGIESPLDLLEPRRRRNKSRKDRSPAYRPRPCPVPHWRSRTSSATTARRGVAPAGHVSLGQLKVMSAIERCRTAALGGHFSAARSALTSTSPTTRAATGIVPSARAEPRGIGSPRARPSCCRCRTATSCSPCRPRSPTSPIRTKPWSTTSCSRPPPRR